MPRRLPGLACLLASVIALAACGSSDSASESSNNANITNDPGAEEAAFPATIRHRYGTTTITHAPKRVVVVGLREQDALLALGVVPVATTEWYGDHPGAIFPWAKKALGNAPLPKKLDFTDGVEFEKVA